MVTSRIEVAPFGAQTEDAGLLLTWPRQAAPESNLVASNTWDLDNYSAAPAVARDLFRITAGAYLADTAVSKPPVSLHRNIELTAHVEDATPWSDETLTEVAQLLHWLTGDAWTLRIRESAANVTFAVADGASRVQLLSGGLDSLCGAIIGLRDGTDGVRFVGHRDASNAVRHAQNKILAAIEPHPYDRHELFIREASLRKNHGPRSRSLMFVAMGALTAANHSAAELWVPENGFTSINPPLDAGRGGTLTTRSTHPYTFHAIGELLRKLNIPVEVRNPFSDFTKGQLVAAAMPELMDANFLAATTASFSCAKGGTQFYGGDSNHNCGLCVACVVRRASFIGAGISDPSLYDSELLSGENLKSLVKHHWRDIVTLRDASLMGIPEEAVLVSSIWPPDTDLDGVLDLVARGLEELKRVPLPSP